MDKIMQIKIEMASLGWECREKISTDGWQNSSGYSVWFERWDWHGKATVTITGKEVVFHAHTEDVSNYEEVFDAVKRAANRAKQAWIDFPDSIPCQNARGEVVQDWMYSPF